MYHPDYLSRLRALCDHYQIHLIADEIAVGGRTGSLFACERVTSNRPALFTKADWRLPAAVSRALPG